MFVAEAFRIAQEPRERAATQGFLRGRDRVPGCLQDVDMACLVSLITTLRITVLRGGKIDKPLSVLP